MNDAPNILIVVGILVAVVFMFATTWKIFEKAGHPGWACLIPVYNTYVLLSIAEMSVAWMLVMWIPYVNLIVYAMMTFRIGFAFRKSFIFGFGLLVLPFLFYPLLAFDDREKCLGIQR
jgi:hypothetical protein